MLYDFCKNNTKTKKVINYKNIDNKKTDPRWDELKKLKK